MNPANGEIRCDGCGAQASSEHLQRRLARLELATRYRPIHMECLVLHPAPPSRMEDYFYKPEKHGGERSNGARAFFGAMMTAAGVGTAQGRDEETLLSEFQRKGWYLAACCECALEESGVARQDVAERYGDSVVKRARFSYKPKRIALASRSLNSLVKVLQNAGFGDVFELQNSGCD